MAAAGYELRNTALGLCVREFSTLEQGAKIKKSFKLERRFFSGHIYLPRAWLLKLPQRAM
jgi:hypothetical protein